MRSEFAQFDSALAKDYQLLTKGHGISLVEAASGVVGVYALPRPLTHGGRAGRPAFSPPRPTLRSSNGSCTSSRWAAVAVAFVPRPDPGPPNGAGRQADAGQQKAVSWSQHFKVENPAFSATFNRVVATLAEYFDLDVYATRLNFYPGTSLRVSRPF